MIGQSGARGANSQQILAPTSLLAQALVRRLQVVEAFLRRQPSAEGTVSLQTGRDHVSKRQTSPERTLAGNG